MNTYIDRNKFNEEIVDLVNDYLDNMDVYPESTCIAVYKQTCDLELFTATEVGVNWETYPITSFLRQNENKDGIEVDIDATLDLADKFYFM